MNWLRSRAKRSRWLVCLATVVKDQRARLAARGRAAPSTSGSTHEGFSLDESLAYIDGVFGDYLTYGGLGAADLAGARVLELGPGDNFGVALRFIAAGAKRVVALDKFASSSTATPASITRDSSRSRGSPSRKPVARSVPMPSI
jgi:hypothetical protein